MLNPDNIHQRLVELGKEWSEANAGAEWLEETKSTLVSQLAADFEGSQTAKEAYAKRHPEYKAHIKAMIEARKNANIAKVNYDSAKVWAELKRTEAANERAANRSAT